MLPLPRTPLQPTVRGRVWFHGRVLGDLHAASSLSHKCPPTDGFHKGSNIRKPTVEKKSFHVSDEVPSLSTPGLKSANHPNSITRAWQMFPSL